MNEDNRKLQEMQNGFRTAFINQSYNSNLAYRPEFLSNNYRKGKKVLVSIEQELADCDEFKISVAFITKSGITPLLQTLEELENRNIPGKILTTNYLNFSEPEAIEKLSKLKNIELKMFRIDAQTSGFHTKGYIFRKEEIYRFIIGSSNMTLGAVTKNREWNTKIVSTEDGEIAQDILSEFEELWNDDHSIDYNLIKETYEKEYIREEIVRKQRRQALEEDVVDLERYRLTPNKMQSEFVANLLEMRKNQIDKALLLSSTGTGKTYAAAFAMRELEYKRVLFLVHRNQIAKQAKKSFEKVFGNRIKTGLVTGGYQDYDAEFIFATVQTLSKEENLKKLSPDYFDCCVYDEAHHTAANSYKRVMDYFKPQLALGMTATPDRRDDDIDGRNIYQLFDYNIAYEIRLQQAMEEDLLCPFHYFGITDLEVIDDNEAREEKVELFRRLTSDERVKRIIEKADYYGYSGDRVKGLIFCSRREEAKVLSRKLNERGLRTVALSGEDSEETRAKAVERLVMDELNPNDDEPKDIIKDGPLDYILSVDIFSEGVDVPQINQVIMLRPTQSPIVFVQQLGRGLRKAEGKEYVVVLDFIGNYANNYMIPIALSGDRTYNKDNVRRHLIEGTRIIPGESTIHFDEISRKKIFDAIDEANFSSVALIKEKYLNLRNKLGKIPALEDFDRYGEMDVLRIFENNSLGSYHRFLEKYENEYKTKFSETECKILEFISKKFASGKRIHELIILKRMLDEYNTQFSTEVFAGLLNDLQSFGINKVSENQKNNLINIMTSKFASGTGKDTYSNCVFIESCGRDEGYRISSKFEKMLGNTAFFDNVKEVVEFGISRYQNNYRDRYKDTNLVLYQKYSYEDVCRLLDWNVNIVPQNIGGYKYDETTKTFPVFINYEKSEHIVDSIKYEDRFVDRKSLIAISKSGRTLKSKDVQTFLKSKEQGINVELFVRKNVNDNGSKEFYYLGRMDTKEESAVEFKMPNTDKKAVELHWTLDVPVREDIYEYIVNG